MKKAKNQRIIVVAYALVLMFSIQTTTFGCLCEPMPVKKRVRKMRQVADAVFTGEVKEVTEVGDRNGGSLRIILTVSKSWKAERPKEYTIYTGGGCAAFFDVGKQYLVYAEKESTGKLTTDVCMGTRDLRVAAKDLNYLGRPTEFIK
jgi:hypothetical protein